MIHSLRTRLSATFALIPQSIQAIGLLLLATFVGTAARLPAEQLIEGAAGAPTSVLSRVLSVGLVLTILAGAIYLARRREPIPVDKFLPAAVLAAVMVKATLIATVEPKWGGDFLRYWDNAIAMVENGGVDVNTSIYKQRASLIFYPVYKIFGDAHVALKIVNAGGWLLTAILAYDMLRIARNHQAAQAFWVLFLLCPMPAFDALFPSHDLWGTMFLALSLWSITRAAYFPPGRGWTWPRAVFYAALCALSVTLLEIQRGAASMLPLAMVIAGLLLLCTPQTPEVSDTGWRLRKRAPLVVGVVALLLFVPLNLAAAKVEFKKSTLVESARAATLMKMAAHGGVYSNAASATWVRFDERFTQKRAEGAAAVADFGLSIVLTSWADPDGSKLRLIRAVFPRLFQLGYPADWNVALRSPTGMSSGVRGALVGYTNAFGTVLALATAFSLLIAALSARAPPLPVLLALVFTLLLAASLLALFENKPPNLYSGWLGYLMLVTWLASTTSPRIGVVNRRGIVTSVVGIALIWGSYTGSRAILDAAYDAEDGRVISDWKVEWQPVGGQRQPAPGVHPWPLAFNTEFYAEGSIKDWIREDAGDDSKRLGKYATDFYTIVEHPLPIHKGDRTVLSKRICTSTSRTSLEFFLFAAYQRGGHPDSFVVEVAGGGRTYKRVGVPLARRNFRMIVVDGMFPKPGCHMIEISVRSNVDRTRESWRRASHVEIWNPRLIETPDVGEH